jgi:quinol monooxygenase YgiN
VMVAATLAEPGCDKYHFAVDLESPGVIHLFEQWSSAAALDEHFTTPHFDVFTQVLLDAASGPAEFSRYEIASLSPLFG